jgi:hypothetical protein
MTQKIPETCRRCERGPLIHGTRWRRMPKDERKAVGGLYHGGRGLCGTCYNQIRHQRRLHDYEPVKRSREDMLEEWEMLRSDGVTDLAIAAERMGVTRAALDKCLERARRDGDPRGVRYHQGQLGGARQGSTRRAA